MTDTREFEDQFWKALKSDRTMMLGLHGVDDGHARPMTAMRDDVDGNIYFFTSNDSGIVQGLDQSHRAIATFTSKGHDMFASIHGTVTLSDDRAVIDRLWNPFIAAWYTGKDDPKLALLRFDAQEAQIWRDASSLMAGIKMLIGIDPKKDYKDKVAQVPLHKDAA